MNSSVSFSLQVLGSASITRNDGVVLTGRAAQRHRLALLALLALAPGGGAKRDKLMAYLWPESDTERARNLLNVSVYVIRQALGEDAILSERDELRLNTAVVAVDVVAFESACAAGEYERAATLYRGPLLDGFFLSDAPDFEHWLDQERDRLAADYAKALELLAERAAGQNDWPSAVDLWRQRAAHNPYDSRVALRLMHALEATGNPAGALQHASAHIRLLEDELALEAPGDIVAMASAIRQRVGSQRGGTLEPAETPDGGHPAISATGLPVNAAAVPARGLAGRTISYSLAAVVLLVALIFGALTLRGGRSAKGTTPRAMHSIAVLPLTNLGNDPADRALADGLSQELIAALSKSRQLRVIGSTSAFAFRDRKIDVRAVADSLHVANILEGSFQKIGARLRVQVRLVDAADGATRWSSTYDRELKDVFAVQNEIAQSVARELGLRLSGFESTQAAHPQTSSVPAYELYLRGIDSKLLRSDSGARAAVGYLQQAIAHDPYYAAAHAGLARLYMRSRVLTPDGRQLPLREVHKHAVASALRAVQLDSTSADAHASLGLVRQVAYDFPAAERSLLRAVELNPMDSRVREFLVHLYVWQRRPQDALLQAQAAVRSDPLSPTANAELARAMVVNGRCDDALKQLQRVRALQPPLPRGKVIAAQCYALQQKWPEALAELREIENSAGARSQFHLAYVLARAGQTDEARRLQQVLIDRWRAGTGSAFAVATTYLGMGQIDETFVWLDRAVDDLSLQWEVMEPLYAELHQDPRFERLLARVGRQKR